MANFDAFETNFNDEPMGEEDPAADFLAREQDELAGLEDDSFEPIEVPPQVNCDPVEESEFSHIQMNGPKEPSPERNYPMHPPRPIIREEAEKIQKWREEHQKLLEQKDADEAVKKEELQQSAKRELEDWYARYKEQIEKSKINNRNAEKELVAERDSDSPGQEWEKIARLCDFNPKSSRNAKDTSRMRSIILQLKQTPLARKAS